VSDPGKLKRSELTLIMGTDTFLGVKPARAWKRARAALRKKYPQADVYGRFAAYRTEEWQNAMANASRTPAGSAARKKYELSSTSTVPVAYHPNGTHEHGDRFDLGGAPINSWVLDTLRDFGWTREFGPRDPNHFKHDGHTANGVLPSSKVYYVVKKGDTVTKIAAKYKVSIAQIARLSKLKSANDIAIGQKLRIK
jgi:LysM repeat protein